MTLKKTTVLDDYQVKAVAHLMREAMPGLAEIVDRTGVELERKARMMSFVAKIAEVREKLGLTIKEAAQQLKVAQYRIKDIEPGAGHASNLERFFEDLARRASELDDREEREALHKRIERARELVAGQTAAVFWEVAGAGGEVRQCGQ